MSLPRLLINILCHNARQFTTANALLAILMVSVGCAVFEEPIDATAGASPRATSATPADQALLAENSARPQQPVAFTIADITELPRGTDVVAFVHFTNLGASRDTDRELALCKALTKRFTAIPMENIASNTRVIVWPVASNDGAGDYCLDMLTKYEPVDITEKVAQQVSDQAAGPFLLAKARSKNKTMIYDLSNLPRRGMAASLASWQQLLGGAPENWPAYRYAQ